MIGDWSIRRYSDKLIKWGCLMSQTQINVEIYADIICPWCYIGRHRLDAAFAARPQVTPRYIWRCFLLNPSMSENGMDRQAYLLGKFGHAASAVYGRIAAAGLDLSLIHI